MQTLQFDGQPAVNKTLTFTLRRLAAATDGSDLFYVSTAPAAADIFLFRDGVYVETFATLGYAAASQVSTYLYTLLIPAAAISTAETVDIVIHDVAAPAFRDLHLQIRTKLNLGQLNVDSTNLGSNANAVNLTAHGTGYSLNAADDIVTAETLTVGGNLAIGANLAITGDITVDDITVADDVSIGGDLTAATMTIAGALTAASFVGVQSSMVLRAATLPVQTGATTLITGLDTGAAGTDDYYNTSIIMITSGTGVGQARIISDYDHTGGEIEKKVVPNRAWAVQPAAGDTYVIVPGADVWSFGPSVELAAIPSLGTAGYGDLIQALWQRFFFKRTQSASTFTMFKANSSTTLGTASVDDDGTVQTSGKVT